MIVKRKQVNPSDFDRATSLIHEYEKIGTKLSADDFKNGLEKFDESGRKDYIDISYQAKKGSKLYNTYGPNFYWTVRKNNKTGKYEFLGAGD